MASTRKLAAIMFTDLVGFTTSAQANEADALRLLKEQEELVRTILMTYNGREIKSTGDGSLIEFGSALEATECAIEIQRQMSDPNARSGGAPVELRIGVHLGDVERRGRDIFGDAVNIAARIGPRAAPGGVCVSSAVFDQVRNKVPSQFEKLESSSLKNVKTPIDLYRVVLPWPRPGRSRAGDGINGLAVLPFTNISPDLNDEYFANGLTEELITELSRLKEVRVISRTSIMQYKGTTKTVSQIGAELGVTSIIEGSVRKAGNRLRIVAQLIDVGSERHLWAKTYDRELNDIFAIQADVATNVAGSLERGVFGKANLGDTPDLEAYTLFLRGLQLLNEDSEVTLKEAVRLFERAIERDPNFARAHAGLARAWNSLVSGSWAAWDSGIAKAEPAARRALALAPDSADAHAALAEIHAMLDRFEEAIAEAQRAIEINPSLCGAYETLGQMRASIGRLDEGLAAFQRAHELDPLAIRVAVNLAWLAQLAGRGDEALGILSRIDRLHPHDPRICDGMAEYYRLTGDFSKATAVLEAGLKTHPRDASLRGDLGVLWALLGKRKEALQVLRELKKDSDEYLWDSR